MVAWPFAFLTVVKLLTSFPPKNKTKCTVTGGHGWLMIYGIVSIRYIAYNFIGIFRESAGFLSWLSEHHVGKCFDYKIRNIRKLEWSYGYIERNFPTPSAFVRSWSLSNTLFLGPTWLTPQTLGSESCGPKRHRDRFCCFWITYPCDQHTDIHTDRPRYVRRM